MRTRPLWGFATAMWALGLVIQVAAGGPWWVITAYVLALVSNAAAWGAQ